MSQAAVMSTNTALAFFLAEKLSWMSCVSRVTWSTADLPCRKHVLREQWVDDWFDTSVDEPLEDFERMWDGSSLGPPVDFLA